MKLLLILGLALCLQQTMTLKLQVEVATKAGNQNPMIGDLGKGIVGETNSRQMAIPPSGLGEPCFTETKCPMLQPQPVCEKGLFCIRNDLTKPGSMCGDSGTCHKGLCKN